MISYFLKGPWSLIDNRRCNSYLLLARAGYAYSLEIRNQRFLASKLISVVWLMYMQMLARVGNAVGQVRIDDCEQTWKTAETQLD